MHEFCAGSDGMKGDERGLLAYFSLGLVNVGPSQTSQGVNALRHEAAATLLKAARDGTLEALGAGLTCAGVLYRSNN